MAYLFGENCNLFSYYHSKQNIIADQVIEIWAAVWQNQQNGCAPSEDRSDWADAQADLSLHWAYTHFVGFVVSRLTLSYISDW